MLYERAQKNLYLRAQLMLRARGVSASPEALAGAMLEGQMQALIVAFLTHKPPKKK